MSDPIAPPHRAGRPAPARVRVRRRPRAGRLLMALAALVLLVVILRAVLGGGSLPRPPAAAAAPGAGGADPFAYAPAEASDDIARATAGNAQVLFTKSPGGALATARRVAAWRPLIDRVTAGTGIDPALLEGLVFVESAGRPQVIAGSDPVNAAGLTQILAATGQSLLGMRIDLAASRRLTAEIDASASGSRPGGVAALLARRAAVDDRFDPARELAATVRYLMLAERQFGREDLAVESYHMGIGNLEQVLGDYDGGAAVPYVQLYFDSTPTRHAAAYRLLAGFGDDSELYYWRVLGAVQIMRLYRTDRAALARLSALETDDDAGAAVLHPPDRTPSYTAPAALAGAYQRRAVVPLPSNAAALGILVSPAMGSGAAQVGAPRSLYEGLRPVALRLLIELAAQVRSLSGSRAPLQLVSTVADERFQRQVWGGVYPPTATGYSFAIERRYADEAQAEAFQAVLDRLRSLDVIAWAREPSEIEITVSSDAMRRLGA